VVAKFQIASNGTKKLRASTLVMIGFAVVFGLLAVFIAQAWLNNQASMQAKNFESNRKRRARRFRQ
jgi:flagellar basal body-associated protein FliL